MAQNPPPLQVIIAAQDNTRAAIDSAKANFQSLQGSANNLKGVLAGLGGALAGLAVVRQFEAFVSAAAAMDDLAEKTGASVENLSALAGVAKISGVSMDVVENSLIRLAKGLAGADEESKGAGTALAALGLKAEELKKLDTADALKIVADRLADYRDGAGKTALAIDLLGKSGAQALPYLKDLAETQNLQAKLTAEQAAQAENLEKNLKRLSASTSGAWKEFSAAVLPTVDEFVKLLLGAQMQTGGLRDEIKKLSADGTIRDWAETGALGVAYLIDAFKNVIGLVQVAGAATANAFVDAQIGAAKIRQLLDRGRTPFVFEKELEGLRALKRESQAGVDEAIGKFLNTEQFTTKVRQQFAALRQAAVQAGPEKEALDYTSRVEKAGAAAKDELRSIETYVQGIREQLVGATEGEFEKMRQKAVDTFSSVDFSGLSKADRDRLSGLFAQVTEDIDALEERARNMQWAKALAEGFNQAATAADKADEALARFNEDMSRQAQDLQFEIDMVGKLSSERAKLAAIRKIDLDAQRAAAAVPADAANRDERLADIEQTARNARERVGELYDTLRERGRDFRTGLTSAVAEYVDRITNDADNIRNAFNRTFQSMEDALVKFVTTGKLDIKSFVDTVAAEFARIQIRNNFTGPLAQALSGSGGGGLLGGLLGWITNKGGTAGQGWTGSGDMDLPSFAVGTDYVPRDMIARIHQGERIVPASENRAGASGVTIVQNISIDSRSDQASIRQAMAAAKEQTKAEILDSMNRGGAFAR